MIFHKDCLITLLALLVVFGEARALPDKPTVLIVKKQLYKINGKLSTLYKIEQPNGVWGYHGIKGQYFDVVVKNNTDMPTSIHWHGLILPNDQDGVPYVTQSPIPAGGQYRYHFRLKQAGTYWMHSHFELQEQQFLSAPLIISDPKEATHSKEVIFFIGDFSQQAPSEILKQLKQHPSMAAMTKQAKNKPDLNDVKYSAFLTNYRTLQHPEIIRVTPGETVRVRVIAGSAMSNFFIKTGILQGEAIAVDGNKIKPLKADTFPLAVAQRIDILVKIPNKEGAYPILAVGEGTSMQTGLILATSHAKIIVPSQRIHTAAGAIDYSQELKIKAIFPLLPREPDTTLTVNMQGNMATYTWKLNHEIWPNITPLKVKENQRVEIIFNNNSMMAHPIHLHGHVFEVSEINGQKLIDGAMRDTVLVLPHSTLKIQFDADAPGNWLLHCHMLYHAASGMMTLLNYEGVELPLDYFRLW